MWLIIELLTLLESKSLLSAIKSSPSKTLSSERSSFSRSPSLILPNWWSCIKIDQNLKLKVKRTRRKKSPRTCSPNQKNEEIADSCTPLMQMQFKIQLIALISIINIYLFELIILFYTSLYRYIHIFYSSYLDIYIVLENIEILFFYYY